MEFPQRKPNRLPKFDYNTPGAYFITICTKDRKPILGQVVGGGALDAPKVVLSKVGMTVRHYIVSANQIPHMRVDKFVIMPNHIHMLVVIEEEISDGTSKSPSPTNARIPRFISAFKRFCHRDLGGTIFQRSYHDHIIRDQRDYDKIWKYIDGNPSKWEDDCFYIK